jgi:signal transduction histidine kinase
MLHDFLDIHRDAIIARTREKLTHRSWPPSRGALENGVPLFLTQVAETLKLEESNIPIATDAIGNSATRHGCELLKLGYNLSEVVHTYGDICQAVTEVAAENDLPITTEEFHTLNRCLDTAIAEAVTEHARLTADTRSSQELERLGQLAHEIRNLLNTALLSFNIVKTGTVAINGSTGAVLGRSLVGLRQIVDNTLSDTRIEANLQHRERIHLRPFLKDLAGAAGLHADYSSLQFDLEPVDAALVVDVDPSLLSSATMNLLSNAFKYTRPGGRVLLRAFQVESQVCIEVEDQCGGIPESKADPFQPFGDRRGHDRSGLGLGLSIARKAVRAQGGDIHIRNMPPHGCVFVIELPAVIELDATIATA